MTSVEPSMEQCHLEANPQEREGRCSSFQGLLDANLCPSPDSYVEVLTSKCNCIWRWGF